MCGRYVVNFNWAQIALALADMPLALPDADPTPQFNLAPTQRGWVLATDGAEGVKAGQMVWGLVPPWSKDGKPGFSTINARAETAATSRVFRGPFAKRRCLVPASGYYEWQKLDPGNDKSEKRPHFIYLPEQPVMLFAGLWERWGQGEDAKLTYTILTQEAAGPVAALHNRNPVVIPPALARDWIHGAPDDAAGILSALGTPELDFYPIGKAVGNVRNQSPQLIERI
ncbi:SOS response-associated peptidase [Pseudoxanthomonas winnipegensis]|uniref:SOS response-associated peptidase n=1 Tax=Pseudoxanthomonas winnipegensis TaxID=2480810 RepID=UPI00102E0881|nr:SOS response-associated peptidase [Pseudoxanthomonas winnipegensis]TAA08224.1 SOS response-associated peptidase [Pseudoxanthomonas winnipegensis]TAH72685.1 SOS response-associated peptidase [Pseudoxanthomonas winnipegensis]